MPIAIDWADDTRQDTLLLRFDEPWTWLEFRQAVHEVTTIIQGQPHVVDVIFNLLGCPPFHRFNGMTHIWHSLRQCNHTRSSFYVLVTRDPNVRVVASVIRQSQPRLRDHLLVVETEADAHAILAHHRG